MTRFLQTDVGMKRLINEDSLNIAYNQSKQALLILCDGVGGGQFGEVASQMTVNHLTRKWEEVTQIQIADIQKWYTKEINEINDTIYKQGQNFADLKGMSTTLVCAVIIDQQVAIAHAGDSRAYVFRYPQLKQVTKDHSLINYLIDAGEINEDDAEQHPMKNVITRAIGSDDFIDIEFTYVGLKNGDVILLCSDGLTDMVEDETISTILGQAVSAEEMCQQLIRIANYKGGKDNISVIIEKYKEKAVELND